MTKSSTVGSIILASFFLVLAFGSTDDSESIETTSVTNSAPDYRISAKKLYSEYDANGVAADLKYKDKILAVTGTVDDIDKDIMDDIYVTLEGDEFIGSIQCFFADSHTGEAANLRKGQTITVKGRCDGQFMNVLLKGCVIE